MTFATRDCLLFVESGTRKGEQLSLPERGPMTFGREDCDVCFDPHVDRAVSRQHATIEIELNGEVHLTDLNARNGTFINGAELSGGKRRLCVGDRIQLGDGGPLLHVALPLSSNALAPPTVEMRRPPSRPIAQEAAPALPSTRAVPLSPRASASISAAFSGSGSDAHAGASVAQPSPAPNFARTVRLPIKGPSAPVPLWEQPTAHQPPTAPRPHEPGYDLGIKSKPVAGPQQALPIHEPAQPRQLPAMEPTGTPANLPPATDEQRANRRALLIQFAVITVLLLLSCLTGWYTSGASAPAGGTVQPS